MSHVGYILKTLRPHRKRLIVSLLSMLGIMLVDLGSPLVVAVLIDTVITQNRYHLLPPLMMVMLALPIAAAGFRFLGNYMVTLLGQRLVFDIRLNLYRRVHRLHSQYIQNSTTGKLMERLRGDVQQLQKLLTNQTPQLLVQVVTGLIIFVIMFTLSAKLAVLVLMGIGMYFVNYKLRIPAIRKAQRRYRSKMDRLSSLAQERLSGTLVVKTFGKERTESRGFVKQDFLAARVLHRFRMMSVNYHIMSTIIMWGNYALVILVGAYLVIQGELTYGMVTAMAAYTFRLLHPAAMLAELSNQLQQAKVSLDRIFELMNAERDFIDTPGDRHETIRGDVRFENVHFEYEPGKPVLQGLDLSVDKGQTIALVGPTGCGKTTIINLLYRYYDVTGGRVLVDGRDIREFSTRWYRRHLSLVPQEPIVFNATISENIRYGNPTASRSEIERAARLAELGELLDRLEHGLDTRLAAEYVTLSVGEKQRLCIARAILADPSVLVLDEATSSLDTHSEGLIQLAMQRVMSGRTCFVIAHRLSTIVHADKIAVMENGKVIEFGSHARLMTIPDGKYRKLYETQMKQTPKARTAS